MLTISTNQLKSNLTPYQLDIGKLLAHLGKSQPDNEPIGYDSLIRVYGLERTIAISDLQLQEYHRQWTQFRKGLLISLVNKSTYLSKEFEYVSHCRSVEDIFEKICTSKEW